MSGISCKQNEMVEFQVSVSNSCSLVLCSLLNCTKELIRRYVICNTVITDFILTLKSCVSLNSFFKVWVYPTISHLLEHKTSST